MTSIRLLSNSVDSAMLSNRDLLYFYEPDSETLSTYDRVSRTTGEYFLIGEKGSGKSHALNLLSTQLIKFGHDVVSIFYKDWQAKIALEFKKAKKEYSNTNLADIWKLEILKIAVEKLLKSEDDRKLFSGIKKKILKKFSLNIVGSPAEIDIHKSIETLSELFWEILASRQAEKPLVYSKEEDLLTRQLPSSRSLYIFIDELGKIEGIEIGLDDFRALFSAVMDLNRHAILNLGEEPNFKIVMAMETQTFRYLQEDLRDAELISHKTHELSWSTKSIKRLLVRRMLPDNTNLTEDIVTKTLQTAFPESTHYFGVEFKSSIDFVFKITGLNPRRVLMFLQICANNAGYTDVPYKSGLSAQEIIDALDRYSNERVIFISDALNFIYPNLRELLAYLAEHRESIPRILSFKNLSTVIQGYLSEFSGDDEQPAWLKKSPDIIIDILYQIGVVGILYKTEEYGAKPDWIQAKYQSDDPNVKISNRDRVIFHPSFWQSLTNVKTEILLHRRLALNIYNALLNATKKLDVILGSILLDIQVAESEKEESLGKFLALTQLFNKTWMYPEPKDLLNAIKMHLSVSVSLKYFSATPLCASVKSKNWKDVVEQTADVYLKIMLVYIPTIGHDKVKFQDRSVFSQKKSELGIEYSKIQSPWLKGRKIKNDEKKNIETFKINLTTEQYSLAAFTSEALINLQKTIGVPPEVLEALTTTESVINYISQSISDKRNIIGESKILIVGQGSVGKTSIINRILYDEFNLDEIKTEGIFISRLQVDDKFVVTKPSPKIQLNIWDFGGQEIMHATHQFFLTKRSLYLLVLDSRLTQEENRVEYWLKIIQSFSDESPVLIVGNKIDQHPLDIDRTGLQKKYPNIVGVFETSAVTGAGIEELKAAITEQVNSLPHVRDLLPETWFAVKTKLEELGTGINFISHDDYDKLCDNNDVHDEISQHTLIGFLHDLGVVLYFQDDPRLESLGILNPQWVTNGVYKILNSHTLFQDKGVLTVAMLDEILNLPEYPRGKRLFIVDMMKKFELCYDIEPDKTFLVPDLLPKDQPDLKFNGIPAFEYAYPVLPSSVITRFIVRMNQKIDDGLVWRTGVVLKIGANSALVKADIEDRKITIAIDGLEHTRRDALSAIRFQLDEIHASIKGLNPQKMVPIPNAPNAEPLEYDTLSMLEREGQEVYLVRDGSRLVKVNVRQVLSGIENESQRKDSAAKVTNIYIGGDVKNSNILAGDNGIVSDS